MLYCQISSAGHSPPLSQEVKDFHIPRLGCGAGNALLSWYDSSAVASWHSLLRYVQITSYGGKTGEKLFFCVLNTINQENIYRNTIHCSNTSLWQVPWRPRRPRSWPRRKFLVPGTWGSRNMRPVRNSQRTRGNNILADKEDDSCLLVSFGNHILLSLQGKPDKCSKNMILLVYNPFVLLFVCWFTCLLVTAMGAVYASWYSM